MFTYSKRNPHFSIFPPQALAFVRIYFHFIFFYKVLLLFGLPFNTYHFFCTLYMFFYILSLPEISMYLNISEYPYFLPVSWNHEWLFQDISSSAFYQLYTISFLESIVTWLVFYSTVFFFLVLLNYRVRVIPRDPFFFIYEL